MTACTPSLHVADILIWKWSCFLSRVFTDTLDHGRHWMANWNGYILKGCKVNNA